MNDDVSKATQPRLAILRDGRDREQGVVTTFDRIAEQVSVGLVSAGLLTSRQRAELLRHAAGFPALPAHRLFLEYRVGTHLSLEGYGHGFDAQTIRQLGAWDQGFTAIGPLRTALDGDPFARDRRRYLDTTADDDPNWIEYDVDGGRLSDVPGVFFGFPARFRSMSDPERARALEARLDPLLRRPGSGGASFWDLLDALIESKSAGATPVGLYRFGLCARRRPDWARVVLNGISGEEFDSAGRRLAMAVEQEPLRWVVRHLAGLGNTDPHIAASVGVIGGTVDAIDVECPFFNRVSDDEERRAQVAEFCGLLVDRGLVAGSVADTLARAAALRIDPSDGPTRALLLLDHFKFGMAGSTSGRVKVYFEVLLRTTG